MTEQETVDQTASEKQTPKCELCEKTRNGAHRINRKVMIPFFIFSLVFASSSIFAARGIGWNFLFSLLGLWLLIVTGEPLFWLHREYWFIDKDEPHAHRLLPRGINNEPLVDTYCEVYIGGCWDSHIFIRGHELIGYFDWHYFQRSDNNLNDSGLQANDHFKNRLRFKFAELAQLFQLLDRPQGEMYNRLTGLLLAEHTRGTHYKQQYNQSENERSLYLVQSQALQQVILIIVDRVNAYRRTLGNSKYGRFVDLFLRKAWLNIFGQPLDTGKLNPHYPALQQLTRDSLAEIGIRDSENI